MHAAWNWITRIQTFNVVSIITQEVVAHPVLIKWVSIAQSQNGTVVIPHGCYYLIFPSNTENIVWLPLYASQSIPRRLPPAFFARISLNHALYIWFSIVPGNRSVQKSYRCTAVYFVFWIPTSEKFVCKWKVNFKPSGGSAFKNKKQCARSPWTSVRRFEVWETIGIHAKIGLVSAGSIHRIHPIAFWTENGSIPPYSVMPDIFFCRF